MYTTRTRTKSEPASPATSCIRHRVYYANTATGTHSDEVVLGEAGSGSTTTDDVVTPNFKRRSAAGEIINNDFYRVTTQEVPPQPAPFTMNYVHKNSDGTLEGSEFSGEYVVGSDALASYLPADLPADAINEKEGIIASVVTEAHANVSALELSLPMVAGEAHKTIESMASITRRVYKIFKAMKRLDLEYLRRQISRKELEERYMELRYALRPLMYDAEGLMGALEASKNYRRYRQTARAGGSFSYSTSDVLTNVGPWASVSSGSTITRTRDYKCSIYAGVLSDVSTSRLNTWGGDNLLQTAWELVPFSFIADWFVNIGDTLAAHVPKAGITQLASWVSIKGSDTWSNSSDLIGLNYLPAYHNYKLSASFKQNKKRIQTFSQRRTNPQLSVWPQVNVSLNPLKLLDLAIITKNLGNISRH